jgi:hypothetical protein
VLDPFEAKPHGFRKRVDDEDLPFWFWLSVGKAMEKTENPMVFFCIFDVHHIHHIFNFCQ